MIIAPRLAELAFIVMVIPELTVILSPVPGIPPDPEQPVQFEPVFQLPVVVALQLAAKILPEGKINIKNNILKNKNIENIICLSFALFLPKKGIARLIITLFFK
jgi:hypothetical protein